MEVFKLFATLGIDAAEFDRGLAGAEQRLAGVEQTFTNAGRTLTTHVTAPVVGLGAAALASSITFESAFAGVRKTVDATEAEFAQLERGIRDMAREIPASAESIAQVAEAAGQLGIQTDNILGFTEVMIGLGESTNMSADEAATALARFANIVQMPQSAFDRLGSTIVDLGNNLATTEGEIVQMGLRIAGAGNQIGLTEAEIMGFAGALSSVGIQAEAGGTAISRVMLTMMTDVMNGGEELEKFAGIAGVTSDEFATAFRERPAEAITMFVSGLGRISSEGGNVVAALEDVGLSEIRVRDALLRMSGAGDVLADSINLATEAWGENSALQEEVGRRYETTESKLTVMWNKLKEVVRTLGDALVPLLLAAIEAATPFIAALQSLAEWFGRLDPGMQAFIVAGAGIVAAIGPILWMIGSFAGAIANLLPLLGMLPKLIGGVGTAFTLLTNPVGLVIAAIAALVAIFATDFLGIRTAVVNAWGAIVDAFRSAGERIGTAFRNIKNAIRDWWDDLNAFLGGLPAKMLEFGKDLIGGLVNGVKSMLTNAVDAVKGVGEGIISGFKSLLGIDSPSKVFHQFGLDIGAGLAQGIKDSEATVVKATEGLAKAVTAAGRAVMRGSLDPSNIVGGITSGLEGRAAQQAIEQRLEELAAQRASLFGAGMRQARTIGMPMIDAQVAALEDELRRLREELRASRAASAREGEAQARRFSMAVTTFDQSVRSLQLARQRY